MGDQGCHIEKVRYLCLPQLFDGFSFRGEWKVRDKTMRLSSLLWPAKRGADDYRLRDLPRQQLLETQAHSNHSN